MLVLTLLRLSSRCASGFQVARSSLKYDRVVFPRSGVLSAPVKASPDLLLRTASRDQPPGPSAFLYTRVLFFYPECFSAKSTQSWKFRPASTRVTSSDITPSSFRAAGPRTPLVFSRPTLSRFPDPQFTFPDPGPPLGDVT
jgi:hypothetical protein